jgi:hypothetical protein
MNSWHGLSEIVNVLGRVWTTYIECVFLNCSVVTFQFWSLVMLYQYQFQFQCLFMCCVLIIWNSGGLCLCDKWKIWYLNVWLLWWSQWCESNRIKTCWTSGFLDIGHCLSKRWTQHFRNWIYSNVQVIELGVICLVESDRKSHSQSPIKCQPTH